MFALSDIQKFIADTLKNDISFNDEAYASLGLDFGYYIDANSLDGVVELPCITVFGIETTDELRNNETLYTIQYNLTAICSMKPIIQDSISIYPTKGILEKLAIKSIELISQELRVYGINGKSNLKISAKNLFLTDIGEADDVQAIVTLQISELRTI